MLEKSFEGMLSHALLLGFVGHELVTFLLVVDQDSLANRHVQNVPVLVI